MSDTTTSSIENAVTDFYEMAAKATDQAYRFWEKSVNTETSNTDPSASILNDFSKAFEELGEAYFRNPAKVAADQIQLMQKQRQLWQNTALKLLGKEVEPVIEPDKGDRRFRA